LKTSLQWLYEFDYLRGFAILAVLCIHTAQYSTRVVPPTALVEIVTAVGAFTAFAVPLFVFISGFVLYYRHPHITSVSAFYKRRLASVLLPYLFFSTFYFYMIKAAYGDLTGLSIPQLFFAYLTGTADVPLYFVVLIIQFYLLYPLLTSFFNRSIRANRAAVFVLAALLIQLFYLSFVGKTNTLIDARVFASSIFYFALGMYLSKNYDTIKYTIQSIRKTRRSFLLFTEPLVAFAMWRTIVYVGPFAPSLGLGYYLVTQTLFKTLFFVSMILALLLICLDLQRQGVRFANTIKKLGELSFAIYLIQASVQYMFVYIIFPKIHLSWNNWLFYPLLFIGTLVFSCVSVIALSYLPLSTYIIGVGRHKNQRDVSRQVRQ
jgi:peptidoglycan/LPS O-acetylase OafA/YrhL